jgi:hypothetical protein
MEMGVVVETSTHSINGKQVESAVKADCQSEASLWTDFPVKHITEAWFASDMRRPAQSDRAGTD